MSSYGIHAKICGVPCGLILRDNTRNGRYQVLFEREYASLEQIEAINWTYPNIEAVKSQPGSFLPEGYGFDVVRITYDSGLKAYTVELQTASQYLGDVTGYQALLEGARASAADNAGAHNAVYRGKSLGSAVTEKQYAAIAAGTFEDLYIGDFWTIGGVSYRIAAFDYFLGIGDTAATDHHAVIVPDTALYRARMNETSTTEGGYVGSQMHTQNLEQAKTIVKTAFPDHVMKRRAYLCNAVSSAADGGKPSAYVWQDSEVELMSGMMVLGTSLVAAGEDKAQLALFAHDPSSIICSPRDYFWTLDTLSWGTFMCIDSHGCVSSIWAGLNAGVRPVFCIC